MSSPDQAPTHAVRVVALNVQHGGGRRTTPILSALEALQPDVVVLSEFQVSNRGDELLAGLRRQGLAHAVSGVANDPPFRDTVAIVSRHRIEGNERPLGESPNGHRVVEARINGLLIAGVYFPLRRPKVTFWRDEFLPYARQRLSEPALLVGDWNSGSHYRDETGATLDGAAEFDQMTVMGWCDAWRSRNPEAREFTWFSPRPHLNGFRLDHGFLSPSMTDELLDVRYAHETRQPGVTDHSALVMDLRRATAA